MTEFEIAVAGEQAQLLSSRGQLTYRMAGAQIRFSFDGEWDALTPHALVRQGDAAVVIPLEGNTALIPGHALTAVGDFVYAGVYGVSADGTVAIPTVWVGLGRLRDGAHIFYDEDVLPNAPIWQTVGEQMGDISRLQTREKNNLVDAVNSVAAAATADTPGLVTVGQGLAVEAGRLSLDTGTAAEHQILQILDGKPAWRKGSWQHLADMTVAEAVNLLCIDACADGTKLEEQKFTELYVEISGVAGDTATVNTLTCYVNAMYPNHYNGVAQYSMGVDNLVTSKTAKYAGVYFDMESPPRSFITLPAGRKSWGSAVQKVQNFAAGFDDAAYLKDFGFYTAAGTIPAGTVFRIWVR